MNLSDLPYNWNLRWSLDCFLEACRFKFTHAFSLAIATLHSECTRCLSAVSIIAKAFHRSNLTQEAMRQLSFLSFGEARRSAWTHGIEWHRALNWKAWKRSISPLKSESQNVSITKKNHTYRNVTIALFPMQYPIKPILVLTSSSIEKANACSKNFSTMRTSFSREILTCRTSAACKSHRFEYSVVQPTVCMGCGIYILRKLGNEACRMRTGFCHFVNYLWNLWQSIAPI